MLLIPSRNHADGYRGVCTLGRWTLLQHLCGPSIWVPRRGGPGGQMAMQSRTFTGVLLAWQAAVRKSRGFLDRRSDDQGLSQENTLRISWTATGVTGSSGAQLTCKDTLHMGSRATCPWAQLPQGGGNCCISGWSTVSLGLNQPVSVEI